MSARARLGLKLAASTSLLLGLLTVLTSSLASATISDLVERVNDAAQMAPACNCTPSVAPLTQCEMIDKLMGESADHFTETDLCKKTWGPRGAGWLLPENQTSVRTYGTSQAEIVTRAEYAKKGNTVLSEGERKKLLKLATDLRDESAKRCCGSDSACGDLMKKVDVSICTSEADQNPAKPDDCQIQLGQYELSAVEQAEVTLALHSQISFYFNADTAYRAAQMTLRKNNVMFPAAQVSGRIVLSPYRDQFGPLFGPDSIRHEFGHACSFIKRELAGSARSLLDQRDGSCLLDREGSAQAYAPMFKNAGTVACLIDLAGSDRAPSDDVCEGRRIEEAAAEAFSLEAAKDAFPGRACSRWPSTKHPAGIDVYACLVKNEPAVRQALSKGLKCSR